MSSFKTLLEEYGNVDHREFSVATLQTLRDELKNVDISEIQNKKDADKFLIILRKFREAIAETDKLKGENYPQLLSSILSVGEDGLYSNSLRFIFELIQNVDDCDYHSIDD